MADTSRQYDYTLKAQVKMVLFIAKEEIVDHKFPLPTLLYLIHTHGLAPFKSKNDFQFLGTGGPMDP